MREDEQANFALVIKGWRLLTNLTFLRLCISTPNFHSPTNSVITTTILPSPTNKNDDDSDPDDINKPLVEHPSSGWLDPEMEAPNVNNSHAHARVPASVPVSVQPHTTNNNLTKESSDDEFYSSEVRRRVAKRRGWICT